MMEAVLGPTEMRETDAPFVPEVSSTPIETSIVADGGHLEPQEDVETTAPLVPDLS